MMVPGRPVSACRVRTSWEVDVRSATVGAALLLLGTVTVITGVLPLAEVGEVADRVWPVLLFVVMITVVTELASEAGLFTSVASRLARWGLDRAWVLWLLVVVLATTSTVFLSLDTTAVLLTPVVVLLSRQVGLPPLPFALTTVWLANTGSLLLPVSNLTNLLAEGRLDLGSPVGFARLMLGPAVAAVVVPTVVLFVVFRRDLMRRYEPREVAHPDDRVLLGASATIVVLLLPALVSGLEVWVPATVAAVLLAAVFAVRRPSVLRVRLVPWELVVLASGLFLVIEAGHALGLSGALASVAGTGDSTGALLQLSGVGALGANVVNNLPAYLALEPVAGSPVRLAALLVGVNAGALVTPWASLATLLWHSRLESLDVTISWTRYALLGLLVVPPTLVAATVLLSVG